MNSYLIPPAFYEDHRSRDLPEEGTSLEVGKKGSRVEVRMDEAAFADLYSDARFYTDPGIAADMGMPGLASSARATLKALRTQNPELTDRLDAERKAKGWL